MTAAVHRFHLESAPVGAPEIKSARPKGAKSSSLLQALLPQGAYARREGDRLDVICEKRGVPLIAARLDARQLVPLLSSGAVRCAYVAGQPRFFLTPDGRKAAFREGRGDDAFADQHREIVEESLHEAEGVRPVRRNLREDPLAMLARQDAGALRVPPSAIEAGERLRRDIEISCLPPKVTANWDRLVVDGASPGSGLQASESQAAARMRVQKALSAVGPDFSGPLMDICGFSKGIGEIERELGLPVRSGKVVLALALKALARHYGLSDEARGTSRQPIRSWGTPDSRPGFPD